MSATDAREHEIRFKTKRVRLFGIADSGSVLPLKVVDDGNGLGKLVVAVE